VRSVAPAAKRAGNTSAPKSEARPAGMKSSTCRDITYTAAFATLRIAPRRIMVMDDLANPTRRIGVDEVRVPRVVGSAYEQCGERMMRFVRAINRSTAKSMNTSP
jgi:hypothetical protein